MADISNRKKIWGWCAFDWASQPYYTLCLTFIFGPYFVSVATGLYAAEGMLEDAADAKAQSLWSLGQTIAGLFIAFSAPFLGAFADTTGRRMPWIILFSLFYIAGAAGLWWVLPDGSTLTWAILAFGIGLVGAEFTTIFTNAILPELGTTEEVGRIGGNAYALGYAGGVTALFIMLLFFAESEKTGQTFIGLYPALGLDPETREGTRFVGPFVALWYVIFMVPFFLWVREPKKKAEPGAMARALKGLKESLQKVFRTRTLFAYLTSAMLYRDALNALYGFGGTYAALVLDWSITQIGIFGIAGAITAAVMSWAGGFIDGRIGPKPVIVTCIVVLIAVSLTILTMSPTRVLGITLAEGSNLPNTVFYICGALIGGMGGVLQSASRTMMVRHADPDRPTEAFGLYALSGKATAFLGPMLISAATAITSSVQLGLSPVIFLFLLGLVLLIWVNRDGTRVI